MQRVAEGETLKEVCRSRGWPYGLVAQWVAETAGLREAYDAASELWVDALAREAVGIADGACAETVSSAKLQVDVRLRLAAKLDRKRYGERTEVAHTGVMPVLNIVIAAGVVVPMVTVAEVPVLEGEVVAANDAEEDGIV